MIRTSKIAVLICHLPLWLIALSLTAQDDFYNDDHVPEIKIYFEQENWDELLDALYVAGDEERLEGSVEIDGVLLEQVGIRYKGFSSVSTEHIKNPFNIKLDYVIDQNYQGKDKIKLSNVIHDPSFLREVMSYEIGRSYMPSGRANYAKLFVNDVYWGLYTNVEAVDKEFLNDHFNSPNGSFFKCNPEQLDLFGENANLSNTPGDQESAYYELYDIKSDAGWADLLEMIDVLNEDPGNVETVLNVDRALWMHAFNYSLVNFDGYIGFAQNYYLYQDINGQFNTILWDLNMSFGSFRLTDASEYFDGFTIEQAKTIDPLYHYSSVSVFPRPLMRNLFENDIYRRMFLAHMRTILEENFEEEAYVDRALFHRDLIEDDVLADVNKFYSDDDFYNNLNETVEDLADYPGLTELMEPRTDFLLEYDGLPNAPEISDVATSESAITLGGDLTVSATVTNATDVWLYYRYGGSGLFNSVEMDNDGDSYSVELNNVGNGMDYYLYADNGNAGKFAPVRAAYEFYSVAGNAIEAGELVINEFMAFNSTVYTDDTGDYDDWIELYNNSDSYISTAGMFLTDDPENPTKWDMPSMTIAPNDYLIVWADEQGSEGSLHANFQLSQLGEYLALGYEDGTILDSYTFDAATENLSFSRFPNGTGDFTEMNPTPDAVNEPVSVYEVQQVDFELYPNPANEYVIATPNSFEQVNVEVRNQHGQLVHSEIVTGTQQHIPTENWSAGVYQISVVKDQIRTTQKLVIIH